ncbi:MAG: hypothetical protein JW730_18340 [Anaerolineales bacterium]|nr:hypothetical protein [Anaerolineales bacterium]
MPTLSIPSPLLEFDEAAHIYRLDGRVIPSVTQVLASVGIIDPSKYGAGAAEFGSEVHAACEMYDLLGEVSNDPRIEPYLAAWAGFRRQKQLDFDPERIEFRACHADLGYAGTVDRATDDLIIDIKSGGVERWHRLQSSAYAWAMPEPLKYDRWCVYLRNDATYMIHTYPKSETRRDASLFLAALAVHQWRNNGN